MRSKQLRYSARFTAGVVGRMVRLKNPLPQHGSYDVIMSSGEPSPPVQASISSPGFDMPDDARLKISPTTTPSPTTSEKIPKPAGHETPDADVEAIEEATPIVQKTLPAPELPPKIQSNGFDMDTRKPLDEEQETDMCLINCIYYTQQCCNCTIL